MCVFSFDRHLPTVAILFLSLLFAAPPAVADEAALDGELDVVILEDFKHGRSQMEYYLRDDRGGHVKLEFEREVPKDLRSGARVRVSGRGNGRALAVKTLAAAPAGDARTTTADAGLDERRAVVLMVDLTNAKASSRYTLNQIAGQMFTDSRSVDGLYREASLGQVSFPADSDGDGKADVFGPIAISYSNSSCNYYDWAVAAEAAAQARGIDLSRYRHRVFVLPRYSDLPACSWAGVANVGCGTYCRAWIAEGESGMVYAHELGHNLNMAHAGTDPGNDGTIDNVYGDGSDPMGSARGWHVFNGSHIDQMGWYAAIPGSVVSITGSGSYQLAAIGINPATSGAPTVLKIAKRDSGDFYYLSYRQPINYDSTLSGTYTGGVNIHRYIGTGYGYTSYIKTLTDGSSFTDSVNGLTVTQVGRANGYATVQVSYGCALGTPQVSLSPATRMLRPGTSTSFAASITNGDVACGATTFTLSYDGAAPGSLSPTALTLTGGQSGSASLIVGTNIGDGSYPLQVTATDADGHAPSHSQPGVGAATLIVDSKPPTAPSNLAGTSSRRGRIALSWRSSADVLSGVAGYLVYRDGTLIAQPTGTSYTDGASVPGTTYTYTVAARDGAGNASARSAAVTVTAGGGWWR